MILGIEQTFKKRKPILLISYVEDGGLENYLEFELDESDIFEWKVAENEKEIKKSSKVVKNWDGRPVIRVPKNKITSAYRLYEILFNLGEGVHKKLFDPTKLPKILFFDIETDIDLNEGFPSPDNPIQPITAFSFVVDDELTVLATKKLQNLTEKDLEKNVNSYLKKHNPNIKRNFKVKFQSFSNEKDMINYAINYFFNIYPVWSGWNIEKFDLPYIYKRCQILGIDYSNVSEIKSFVFKNEFIPKHKGVVDYYKIFLKWDRSVKIKENYTLGFISKEITKVPKVEFEGNLKDLYEKNFDEFVLYNSIDSVLVSLINDFNGLLNVVISLANISRVELTRVYSSVFSTEIACCWEFLKRGKIMVPKELEENNDEEFPGGLVYGETSKIFNYCAGFDFTSLYPNIDIHWNIAPDTYLGTYDAEIIEKLKKRDVETLKKIGFDSFDDIIWNESGSIFKRNEDGVYRIFMRDVLNNKKKESEIKDIIQKKIERIEKVLNLINKNE